MWDYMPITNRVLDDRWAIIQLGDMSSKYSTRLNKVVGGDAARGNIHNTLPIWLSMCLTSITKVQCLKIIHGGMASGNLHNDSG